MSSMSPRPMAYVTSITAIILAVFGFSCSNMTNRTEIIVVVDTELEIPSQLTAIRVEVMSPAEIDQQTSTESLSTEDLPATVGLSHAGGPLGPYEIQVIGRSGAAVVIERVAQVSFISGRTAVVELPLLASCVGVLCGTDETCGFGGCRPVAIDPSEYSDWSGTPPAFDFDADIDADADADETPDADSDEEDDAEVDE